MRRYQDRGIDHDLRRLRTPFQICVVFARMAQNIVHFAIQAEDVERARRFYEGVFGWRFEPGGPPGFYDIETGDEDNPGILVALHGRDGPLTGRGIRGFTCTVAVHDLPDIR